MQLNEQTEVICTLNKSKTAVQTETELKGIALDSSNHFYECMGYKTFML